MQMLSRPALGAAFACLLPLVAASCEVVETRDLLAFTIPLTYEVPVTVPIVYPGSERIAQLQAANERSIDIVSYVPVDLGNVDERIASADVVEEVRIEAVTMEVVGNTLSDVDLQPFEIRVGEPGTQILGAEIAGEDWDAALTVAATPMIQAAAPPFTGTVEATIDPANQAAAAEQVAHLQFGLGFGTQLSIEQGNLPSGGRADVRFTFQLAIVVNPL